jgi:RNA 2',3'-cyclic 3'-phosphodiesterase
VARKSQNLRSSRSACRQNVCAPSGWRVFCAIEPPEEVCARASDHVRRLRHEFPDVNASWNRDGKFHLTLKFLGEIPKARVENLSLAAGRAVEGLSSFNLAVEKTGAFPDDGPPRVLWIGVSDPSRRLNELYESLEEECARESFPKDARPFHPHLTLARLRPPHGARALASAHKELPFDPMEMIVSELLVIRSELGSKGSKYCEISRHVLGAQASCLQ